MANQYNGTSAALITGAIGLAGSLANLAAQKNANKENQLNSNLQYAKERRDALADWQMNNDYNSPQEQMKRLQAAGLNPNLVYGTGAVANNSSGVNSVSKEAFKKVAPKLDLDTPVQGYFDTQMKTAQLDNLKTQNTVLFEESLLKRAQRDALEFGTGYKKKAEPYTLEELIHRKNKTAAEADIKESESRILHNLENINYETAAEKLTKIRLENAKTSADTDRIKQGYRNLIKSGELQQLEIEQRRKGISASDPIYFRVLGRLLEKYGIATN